MLLVADFLHVHSSSSAQGLAVGYLKALSWVAKHAGFPELLVTLQLPLTSANADRVLQTSANAERVLQTSVFSGYFFWCSDARQHRLQEFFGGPAHV